MKRKRWNDFKKLFDGNLWIKAAACGFVLTVLLRFTGFSAQCDELSRNMLRLHVLANSDTQADQETKLLVRDAVLTETAKWYADAENFDEALACVCAHVESIEAAANRVLAEQGKEYRAALEIGNAYFPTRIYGETVVPAGKYRTVRVTLGEAKGKNWWCVLYPSVCISGASEISDLPKGAKSVLEGGDKMQIRFKTAEIFTRLLDFFDA